MKTQAINATIQDKRPLLKRFASKFTKDPFEIEDLVQETCMRSLSTIEKLLHDPKLLTWLFVIMKNVYINKYRKNTRYKVIENELISRERDYSSNNSALSNFALGDIEKAMKKLSDTHYECFSMYIEGYKYHEIADHLQVPEGTIKTRIHLSRKILQKELRNYRE